MTGATGATGAAGAAARNAEFKARCEDLATVRERARRLGASPAGILVHEDVYFRVPEGRLKLRLICGDCDPDGGYDVDGGEGASPRAAELIRYRRPDNVGVRESEYSIAPVSDPRALFAVLSEALGVLITVRKRRELWLTDEARVHLDEVAELGSFVEVEVLAARCQSSEAAHARADELCDLLCLERTSLVAGSYSDLLLEKHRARTVSGTSPSAFPN